MIGRREAMRIVATVSALFASGSSLGQEPMPATGEISRFVYRFFDALEQGKYDVVLKMFSDDDAGGMGSSGEPFTDRKAIEKYLRTTIFGGSMIIGGGPTILDELLVCARWTEVFPDTHMPILGREWLFVFGLQPSSAGISIKRLNVININ